MNILQAKKRAFISLIKSAVSKIIQSVSGALPLILPNCYDNDSLESYTIYGNEGGVGNASKNLLVFPYINANGTTKNGITFTYGEDGSCYLNGATINEATSDFELSRAMYLQPGTYTLSGCPQGGSSNTYRLFMTIRRASGSDNYINEYGNGTTFTLSEGDYIRSIYIRFLKGLGTVENLLIKPMLEIGNAATEYEQWYSGYKIPIMVKNENGEIVETIETYLDQPLQSGDSISYPGDAPKLPTVKGTTVYEVGTTVQPSNMEVSYYATTV